MDFLLKLIEQEAALNAWNFAKVQLVVESIFILRFVITVSVIIIKRYIALCTHVQALSNFVQFDLAQWDYYYYYYYYYYYFLSDYKLSSANMTFIFQNVSNDEEPHDFPHLLIKSPSRNKIPSNNQLPQK